MLSELTLRF